MSPPFSPRRKRNNGSKCKQKAKLLPLPSHLTFFSIPAEVRNMIYRLLLIRPSSIEVGWGALAQVQQAYCKATTKDSRIWTNELESFLQSTLKTEEYDLPSRIRYDCSIYQSGLPLQLFGVSKRMNEEACPLFYSENSFSFSIGWRRNVVPLYVKCQYQFWKSENRLRYRTTEFPIKFLRCIKNCEVLVTNVPALGSHDTFKTVLIALRDDIAVLAAGFSSTGEGGERHALKKLRVNYIRNAAMYPLSYGQYMDGRNRPPTDKEDNVLEPLGMVYGVKHVEAKGMTDLFSRRLKDAMMSESLRVVPKKVEELWKVKPVRKKKWTKVCASVFVSLARWVV